MRGSRKVGERDVYAAAAPLCVACGDFSEAESRDRGATVNEHGSHFLRKDRAKLRPTPRSADRTRSNSVAKVFLEHWVEIFRAVGAAKE